MFWSLGGLAEGGGRGMHGDVNARGIISIWALAWPVISLLQKEIHIRTVYNLLISQFVLDLLFLLLLFALDVI